MSSLEIVDGSVFIYNKKKRLIAFKSGDGNKTVLFIGGLTDGILSNHYLVALNTALNSLGWSFVQPTLSSSYQGFGTSSLYLDVEEIDLLIECCITNFNTKRIVLCGHSTGCQDSVHYMKHGKHRDLIQAIILQGPASDREYMATLPNYSQYLQLSEQMLKEGRGEDLMPRDAIFDNIPTTANRFHSLAGKLDTDDMFSSDLTDSEMQSVLGHVQVPTLLVISGKDEFIPPPIDIKLLAERMKNTIKNSEVCFIEDAGHFLTPPEHTQAFVKAFTQFLGRIV